MKKNTLDDMRLGVGKKFPISPSLFVGLESLVLTFVLEILSRRSFVGAVEFLIGKPILFFYGWTIVAATLAFAMMFRKKVFTVSLMTALWLAFGISNCILLSFRGESPLTAVDLQLGLEAITMMPAYFRIWQIVLIAIAVVAVIAGLVLLAIKTPRFRSDWQKSLLRLTSFLVVFLVYTVLLFAQEGMISRNLRPSLYKSYKEYGFPYCFCYSFFDVGIHKPKAYSPTEVANISSDIGIEIEVPEQPEATESESFIDEFIESVRLGLFESEPENYTVEAVDAIRTLIRKDVRDEQNAKPNIVFVQLESFFDPLSVGTFNFSGDPIPNFRALMENYTSGQLFVPTVSGGTVNTEFEVLTGCSLDFFGAGEFPYYSLLRKKACETLATDLRAQGYTATAVHNYTGSFYYRNTIYENMGFNRFVCKEYMNGFEQNPKGWLKDNIFPGEIEKAVKATEGPDFIYAITMQTHGAYIELPEGVDCPVTVTGEKTDVEIATMNYYLSQIVDTDKMIGELISMFEEMGEDTVIVFFGDHLPGLDLVEEELSNQNIYATQYVIWDNMGLTENDRDVEAYQLGAWTMEQIGNDVGVMVRFHQMQMDDANYQQNFEILEYDMLYGDRFIYGGNEHTYENKLEMGLKPVTITRLYDQYGNLFVEGENFTYASCVEIDGDRETTIFVSPNLLIVAKNEPADGSMLAVVQISDEGIELSRTESMECVGLQMIDYNS